MLQKSGFSMSAHTHTCIHKHEQLLEVSINCCVKKKRHNLRPFGAHPPTALAPYNPRLLGNLLPRGQPRPWCLPLIDALSNIILLLCTRMKFACLIFPSIHHPRVSLSTMLHATTCTHKTRERNKPHIPCTRRRTCPPQSSPASGNAASCKFWCGATP